jgi:flavoprotein
MGQKPMYLCISYFRCGRSLTNHQAPDGKDLKITIRKEDVEHVQKLAKMYKTFILKHLEILYPCLMNISARIFLNEFG